MGVVGIVLWVCCAIWLVGCYGVLDMATFYELSVNSVVVNALY